MPDEKLPQEPSEVTLLGESLQTRARVPPNLAVAQSEFARFVHLARKAFNIKLGLSNDNNNNNKYNCSPRDSLNGTRVHSLY
jgi:hypothetical protein